jgi:signal transduction histidine kinase
VSIEVAQLHGRVGALVDGATLSHSRHREEVLPDSKLAASGYQMSAQPIHVLLIEDNLGDVRLMQEILDKPSSVKLQLTHHNCIKDALSHLATHVTTIVLLDLGLPDANGLAAVREILAAAPSIPLVVLTGLDDEVMATQVLHEGVQDYLIKGQINAQGLLRSIRYAIERKHMQVEIDEIRRLQLRVRDDFIATVSHELRTPLTSIRGALGLIDAGVLGTLPRKAGTMVRIAHQNSERLVRIINDILDVEKINAGGLAMRIGSVRVQSFLQQALDVNQAFGVKYQVQFLLEDACAHLEVAADPDRLMQVMANLLSNAVKFSSAGSTVRVRAMARGSQVRVEVEDHGIGIPSEFLERVFEKFAQADSSSSRRFEGTGLGLSITRQLLEAMGGKIGFTTAEGKGTTFYFELPQMRIAQSAYTEAQLDMQRSRVLSGGEADALQTRRRIPRILHVEDDVDLSHVLEVALGDNTELVRACSLRAAEELLRQEPFALLLLDIELPDGSGLSLLEQIPTLISYSLPVIILSVSDVAGEVRQRVAAALIKSRVSEAYIRETILSVVHQAEVSNPAVLPLPLPLGRAVR